MVCDDRQTVCEPRPNPAGLIAGERCPLCGDIGRDGIFPDYRSCCGEVNRLASLMHPPVLLAWQWDNEASYQKWYADPKAYHVCEATSVAGKPCALRYAEHRKAARARMKLYEPLLIRTDGRVWDVGAGNGAFVDEARMWGWHAEGVEPNAELTRMSDFLHPGTWLHVPRNRPCDAITVHDVFEHLTRPEECLRHLREALAPTGLLIIEMPEYHGSGDWRKHLKPKEHIVLYSRQAAEWFYGQMGLETVLFYRPLHGTIGKMAHVLRRMR